MSAGRDTLMVDWAAGDAVAEPTITGVRLVWPKLELAQHHAPIEQIGSRRR